MHQGPSKTRPKMVENSLKWLELVKVGLIAHSMQNSTRNMISTLFFTIYGWYWPFFPGTFSSEKHFGARKALEHGLLRPLSSNSRSVATFEVIWRPSWSRRPPNRVFNTTCTEFPGKLRLLISIPRSKLISEAIEAVLEVAMASEATKVVNATCTWFPG